MWDIKAVQSVSGGRLSVYRVLKPNRGTENYVILIASRATVVTTRHIVIHHIALLAFPMQVRWLRVTLYVLMCVFECVCVYMSWLCVCLCVHVFLCVYVSVCVYEGCVFVCTWVSVHL